MTKLNNDKVKGIIRLVMNKDFTSGALTYKATSKSGNKYYIAKTTILPGEYVLESKPKVSIRKNNKKERRTTISKNLYDALGVSTSIWNMTLMEQTQTDLRSIGFSKFFGKYE